MIHYLWKWLKYPMGHIICRFQPQMQKLAKNRNLIAGISSYVKHLA